jgi:hypothetical protein
VAGAGDVGTIVLVYDNDVAFEVEFVASDGTTRAVTILGANDIRPVHGQAHATVCRGSLSDPRKVPLQRPARRRPTFGPGVPGQ